MFKTNYQTLPSHRVQRYDKQKFTSTMMERVSWVCSSIARDSTSTKEMISSTSGKREEAPFAQCALAESGSSEIAGTGQSLTGNVLHRQNAKLKLVQSVQKALLKNLILKESREMWEELARDIGFKEGFNLFPVWEILKPTLYQ